LESSVETALFCPAGSGGIQEPLLVTTAMACLGNGGICTMVGTNIDDAVNAAGGVAGGAMGTASAGGFATGITLGWGGE